LLAGGDLIPKRRDERMRGHQFILTRARRLGLGLVLILLTAGCSDDRRTTGTLLQLSPEAKAESQDIRQAMREQREERKAARQKARAKGGHPKSKTAPKEAGKTPG
jgi:hypothetical protein